MPTRMAKSFADAGVVEMLRHLCYKAEWAGREYREMPTFDRSTWVCPECGWVAALDCHLPCVSGAVMAAARCTIATRLRRR